MDINSISPYRYINDFPRQSNYSNMKSIRKQFTPLKDVNIPGFFDSKETIQNSRYFIIQISSHDDIHKVTVKT